MILSLNALKKEKAVLNRLFLRLDFLYLRIVALCFGFCFVDRKTQLL